MHYQIIANGTYRNIYFIKIDNTISIKIKCTGCGTEHKNPVTLTTESLKLDNGNNKWNLIVKCILCEHEMKLNLKISNPRIISEDFDSIVNHLSEKEKETLSSFKGTNFFILGEIICDLCNVINISGILYKVYSETGKKYTPQLTEPWIILEEGNEISIRDFYLELKRIK